MYYKEHNNIILLQYIMSAYINSKFHIQKEKTVTLVRTVMGKCVRMCPRGPYIWTGLDSFFKMFGMDVCTVM